MNFTVAQIQMYRYRNLGLEIYMYNKLIVLWFRILFKRIFMFWQMSICTFNCLGRYSY